MAGFDLCLLESIRGWFFPTANWNLIFDVITDRMLSVVTRRDDFSRSRHDRITRTRRRPPFAAFTPLTSPSYYGSLVRQF